MITEYHRPDSLEELIIPGFQKISPDNCAGRWIVHK